MTTEQKTAFLLLQSVILHRHGQEEGERATMQAAAAEVDGEAELDWVRQFVDQEPITAFERARAHLHQLATDWDTPTRLAQLARVWHAVSRKGFISEMEATTILKLAKDWQLQRELITLVRQKSNG